jgi:excisionase family DNA binding protein
MTHDETDNSQIDPLTVGELISLQDAAEYAGLTKGTLHAYAKNGRLKAKKIGWMWVTTRAAIDEYLKSRDIESIPKRYRKPS